MKYRLYALLNIYPPGFSADAKFCELFTKKDIINIPEIYVNAA